MAKVVMYIKDYCPYCTRAKNLLKKKGVEFEEIDITHDDDLQHFVVEKSGRRTVPQIFINDQPVGGSDDIHYLNSVGELDKLLAEPYPA
ncbi:MAG: glutaredoxin 3 [Candidatus Sericytochromatia bacterium]